MDITTIVCIRLFTKFKFLADIYYVSNSYNKNEVIWLMYRMATVSENLQDIQTLQTNTNSHETSDDDPPESKRKKLEDETKSSSQIVQPAKIQHISDDEESDDGAFCTVVSLLL